MRSVKHNHANKLNVTFDVIKTTKPRIIYIGLTWIRIRNYNKSFEAIDQQVFIFSLSNSNKR